MHINFQNVPRTGVPDEWIYRHNLQIKGPFDGRVIRIKSPFTNERTPSFFLYVKGGKYVWKDHSSGLSGDSIDLVVELIRRATGDQTLGYAYALQTTRKEYDSWKLRHGEFNPTIIESEIVNYQLVSTYQIRQFNNSDLEYWGKIGVTEKLLTHYNVLPLKKFALGKNRGHSVNWFKALELAYSYGFFNQSGDLIKIYNPFYEDLKHVTLQNDLLGREQLDPRYKTLLICASMKDMLAVKALDLEVAVTAPIGEKVLIKKDDINDLKEIYSSVLTLFDNDNTGVRAMLLYKQLYDIDFVYVPYCKDVAEFRASEDPLFVKHELVRRINKHLVPSIYDNKDEKEGSKEVEHRHPIH